MRTLTKNILGNFNLKKVLMKHQFLTGITLLEVFAET